MNGIGDAIAEEAPAEATTYCTRPPTGAMWGFVDLVQTAWCGANEVGGTVLGGTTGAAKEVVLGAQDTIGDLGGQGINVAGESVAGAQHAIETVANPLNLFAAGTGAVVGAVGVGLVAALAADFAFAGGAGTARLAKTVGLG